MSSPVNEAPEWLTVPATPGRRIALRPRAGQGTPILWVGGFRSDMMSTKALALDALAARLGHPMIRFDYAAHGESPGRFEEMTLSDWLLDTLTVIDTLGDTPPVIVGSSMGGWITLLAMRARHRLGKAPAKALVLIAPAVDFTQALLLPRLPESAHHDLATKGQWLLPSAYSHEPTPITRALIEDGAQNLLFGAPIRTYCPVHILQGMLDTDVPYEHALKLVEHLPSDPATLTLIKDGDHRLSRDQDIMQLLQAIDQFV